MLANKFGFKQQGGYTVVELLVVVSLMAIVTAGVLGQMSSYYVTIMRNNTLANMTLTSQNLLRTTVENIRFGDGVRQSNQITDTYAPSGGWNTSNSTFVIIIAVPALDQTRNYVVDPDTGSPYMNELIYYKNGSTLMERRLKNPNATTANFTRTCPPANATTTCPADVELAKYVNSMTFTLYDQDGVVTNVPANARSVYITLNMQRNAPGNPINLSTNMRVTLRNRF